MSNLIDITGNKYGHLTVVRRGHDLIKKNGKKEPRWVCLCDCGNPNEVEVLGYNLKNGNTKSCGCEHLKNGSKAGKKYGSINGKLNKKYNEYKFFDDYIEGYTLKGEVFYIDIEDYEKVKDICWHKNNDGYIVNKTDNGLILMHRLIMGLNNGYELVVDHINHCTYDNRKSNLRIVTNSQNHMNTIIPSNNKSGVKGVSFYNKQKKWAAEIGVDKKKIFLGLFDSFDDAVKSRKNAEIKYFKEYRYLGGEEDIGIGGGQIQ